MPLPAGGIVLSEEPVRLRQLLLLEEMEPPLSIVACTFPRCLDQHPYCVRAIFQPHLIDYPIGCRWPDVRTISFPPLQNRVLIVAATVR